MSATKKALALVDIKSKYTVFGFNREASDLFNCNIPIPISHLCLVYYFESDNWDKKRIRTGMKVENCTLTKMATKESEFDCRKAFLLKRFNQGKHCWKFKIKNIYIDQKKYPNWTTTLGIVPISNKRPLNAVAATFLWNRGVTRYDGGYGFGYQCGKIYPSDIKYGKRCTKNDIIEMIVDCDKAEISYKINGINYGKAFDIDTNNTYQVCINLDETGDSIQLL